MFLLFGFKRWSSRICRSNIQVKNIQSFKFHCGGGRTWNWNRLLVHRLFVAPFIVWPFSNVKGCGEFKERNKLQDRKTENGFGTTGRYTTAGNYVLVIPMEEPTYCSWSFILILESLTPINANITLLSISRYYVDILVSIWICTSLSWWQYNFLFNLV